MPRFAVLPFTAGLIAAVLLAFPRSSEAQAPNGYAVDEAPVRYDSDFLPASFHRDRRAQVLRRLPDNAVAVVFSAPERNRQGSVDYEYRQSNDLYYLTGVTEPGAVLVLAPGGIDVDGVGSTELLFVPDRDPSHELWEGRRLGVERAASVLGLDATQSLNSFEVVMDTLLARPSIRLFHLPLPRDANPGSTLGRQLAFFADRVTAPTLPVDAGSRSFVQSILQVNEAGAFRLLKDSASDRSFCLDAGADERVRAMVAAFRSAPDLESWSAWRHRHLPDADNTTLRVILDQLRAVKTDEELILLRRAIDITAAAHVEVMKSIEPGMHEYEAEAVIEYVFKREGAEAPGFPSIVASGENSTILHYTSNRRQMEAGDIVVMDIGAEYRGYTADVTRTVPVGGRFSAEQRLLYDLVLEAQVAAIAASRPGASSGAPNQVAARILAAGLAEIGLLDDADDLRGLRRFFMHGTSHSLGLEVHDVPVGRTLAPGHVITIEPGLYVSPDPDVDPRWWNIGIRIEDDVLITDGEPLVLSGGAPKQPEDIEALMLREGIGNQPVGLR